MSTNGDAPDDTLRERAGANRLKLRLLLDADRRLVAAVPLCFVFAALVVLGALDPAPLREAASSKDPVETLFQALTTAIITGVTLVVSLNQLVLSQELGPLGDQRERMESTLSARGDVADALDRTVAPAEPSAFLRALVERTGGQADDLRAAVDAAAVDDEAREGVVTFADSLVANADEASDALDGAQFGSFDVLSAALNFNYSWKLYEASRLQASYTESLPDSVRDRLDDLVETLRLFGPAREHVKTLYFQWALVDLSRGILFSAIPALVVSMAGVLYLDNPATVTGTLLGVDLLVWVVAAAAAVSLTPFTLLFAYVLRIATVAKRTLSIGPFILRDRDGSDTLPD